MTKKTFLGAMAVVTAVALTGGALVASNMGFKLNYSLTQSGVAPVDGTNTIALPDNRQTGLADAKNLMDDIGSAAVQNIARYVKATAVFQTYTGRKNGGLAFPLVAGEGYVVKMFTNTNYVVVGSDDPALTYSLTQSGVAPVDGTNFFSYNYHQTAADAKALMDDIGSASVQNLARYVKATAVFQTYTGRKNGGLAFPLVPGEAYVVKMFTTVNYAPSHY
jgi:protein-disulfide isomerase